MAVMIIKPLSLKWLGCMIATAAGPVFPMIQLKNGTGICCTVYLERLFKFSKPKWRLKCEGLKFSMSQNQPKIRECEKGAFREGRTMMGYEGIAEYGGVKATHFISFIISECTLYMFETINEHL